MREFFFFTDEAADADTRCDVCNVQCKTERALITHLKSSAHLMRASALVQQSNKEEKQGQGQGQGHSPCVIMFSDKCQNGIWLPKPALSA